MKTVHIISHSHWDREWYLPYERHHMLLIELIDDVLELFETDPEFKSFYLDGQTIILNDYLEVRPQKEALLRKHIGNGKLKIGPFYILQDAFLTSSESNVRNMLMGHYESEKWGQKTKIGYYPDTFGNVGQTPQLMKQLGFELAAFGRGVKPTGFANQTQEQDNFVSSYSEMKWQGIDGSEIFGLLFANWYSNGNEIPSDKDEAKKFWNQKLKETERYASTDHLLMMNGCDHQPVQKDLSKAIQIANELYPEYHFVHSDFPTYIKEIMKTVPDELDTVTGELTSQETEGWYTLTNTASSRVYLKQANDRVGRLLEQVAEPLATLAYEVTGSYPHDMLDYAWKVYMQNHPHDSICGCSVDEVHEEMMIRFQKAEEIGNYIVDEAVKAITGAIDTKTNAPKEGTPFIVFNTSGFKKSQTTSVTLELDKIYFSEQFPTRSFHELKEKEKSVSYKIIDETGKEVPSAILEIDPSFNYDLPKDAFRQPYMARNIEVEIYIEQMPPLSWKTFYLIPVEEESQTKSSDEELVLQNDYLKVRVEEEGMLYVEDKINNYSYKNLLVFEDKGDIGNEYVYKQPIGEKPIISKERLIEVFVSKENPFIKELTLVHEMEVPLSAEELLDEEQKKIIEFRNRRSKRVEETKPLRIETKVALEKHAKQLCFETKVTNEMKDHRLRVLFKTGISSDIHYADTIFETVKRPNKVSESWTNPENPQRTHRFINVRDEYQGMVISPEGLNEYEIIEDNGQQTIALTLFRSVGELGDWGYFPTPGAQCFNKTFTFNYQLSFHGNEDVKETLKEAIASPLKLKTAQAEVHDGELKAIGQFLSIEGESIALTALKRNKKTDAPVTRFYNFTDKKAEYTIDMKGYKPVKTTILEEVELENEPVVKPFEIVTHKWEKQKGNN